MKQGTISVLIGCHSPIHSALVVLAWRRLYGRWPRPWQVVCIFLHDIGHWGRDYLDDYEQKREHWKLGARIAQRLFGVKGWQLTAGHCSHSGMPLSDLYKADKYSYYLAPRWWLYANLLFEPKLKMGYGLKEAVARFQDQVRESIESGEFRSTHSMYMNRCQGTGRFDGEEFKPRGPQPDEIKCGLIVRGNEKTWGVDVYVTEEALNCMQGDGLNILRIDAEIPFPEAERVMASLKEKGKIQ
jgi:hypothetical protein